MWIVSYPYSMNKVVCSSGNEFVLILIFIFVDSTRCNELGLKMEHMYIINYTRKVLALMWKDMQCDIVVVFIK